MCAEIWGKKEGRRRSKEDGRRVSERGDNPLRRALEAGGGRGPHPDADLLTAFGEGALTGREREGVLDHLARCAECRDVVRVASEAETMPAPVVVMPARRAAVWRLAPWLAAAAVLLVVSGIVVRQQVRRQAQPATARAVAAPAPQPQAAANERSVQVAKSAPVPREAKKVPERQPKAAMVVPKVMAEAPAPLPPGGLERYSLQENTVRSALAPQAGPSGEPIGGRRGVVAARIAPPPPMVQIPSARTQPNEAKMAANAAVSVAPPAPLAAPPPATGFVTADAMRSFANDVPENAMARARWRIDAHGEPERAIGSGPWQKVPLVHGGRMQAIAVLGTEVWAGGQNAELYRSLDNGATWTPVTLPVKGEGAHTIAHIRMDSSAIVIEAADGTTWTSDDGGATWK